MLLKFGSTISINITKSYKRVLKILIKKTGLVSIIIEKRENNWMAYTKNNDEKIDNLHFGLLVYIQSSKDEKNITKLES